MVNEEATETSTLSASAPLVPLGFWRGAGDRGIVRVMAGLLALIGLAAIVGWVAGIALIVQAGTDYVPMQFNTALCCVLLAVCLVLLETRWSTPNLVLLIPVVLLSAASLADEYGGWALGVGEWLIRHSIVAEGVGPGRMAPNTATGLLLAATGIVLAPRGRLAPASRWTGTWACGLLVAVLGSITLVAYAFDVPAVRAWGSHTPMALLTGVALVCLGLGLAYSGSGPQGGQRRRALWLPLIVASATILTTFGVWYGITRDQQQRAHETLVRQLDVVERALTQGVEARVHSLGHVADRVANAPDIATRDYYFKLDSGLLLRDFPSLGAVVLTDHEGRILQENTRHATIRALLGGRVAMEERMPELSAGKTVIVDLAGGSVDRAMIVAGQSVRGLESSAFVAAEIEFGSLFENLLSTTLPDSSLRFLRGDTVIFSRGSPVGPPGLVRDMALLGIPLRMQLWSAPAATGLGNFSTLLLFSGLAAGGLLALALRLAVLARQRAELAEATGRALRDQIIEHARARDALATVESELTAVFDTMSDGFCTLTHDWRFSRVNPRAGAWLHREPAELVGMYVWNAFPETVGTEVEDQLRRAAKEQCTVEFELPSLTRRRWLAVRIFPNPNGLSIYFQDITERKETEQVLARIQLSSTRAQRLAQLGDWEYDLASGEARWSDDVARMLGLSAQGAHEGLAALLNSIDARDRERVRQARLDLITGDGDIDIDIEYRVVGSDGSRRAIREIATLVRDGNGLAVAAAGAVQDITERKRAEEALWEMARRLEQSVVLNRLVMDNSLDVICAIDANGRFSQVSAASASVWGYPAQDLLGRAVVELVDPKDRAATDTAMAEVRSGRPTRDFRNRHIRKDGQVIIIQWSLVWSERERMIFAVARDVTEAERQSQALRDAKESLQRAQQVARMGAWQLDVKTQQLTWSAEVFSLFQVSEGEFGGNFEAFVARVHPDDLPAMLQAQEAVLAGGPDLGIEHRIIFPGGGVGHVHERAKLVLDESGSPRFLAGSVQDITDAKIARGLEARQRAVLASIAGRCPLADSLTAIVRLFQHKYPEALCSVLLLDDAGEHVLTGAAPDLPAAFSAALDGQSIGPRAGSCGTAAWRGETVVVTDIENDPLWLDYRQLASEHGLRACWSVPVKSAQGRVLATFATYYREPRTPAATELAFMNSLVALVAMAVEQVADIRRIELSEQRFRSLFDQHPDAVYAMDLDGHYIDYNGRLGGPDLTIEQIRGQRFDAHVAPEERDTVRRNFDAAVRGEARSYETTAVIGGNRRVDVRVTNLPIVVDGRVEGVYGIAQDITQLRQNQRDLDQALDVAQERSQQLGRLSESAVLLNQNIAESDLYSLLVEHIRKILDANQAVASVGLDGTGHYIHAASLSDKYAQWRQFNASADNSGIYALVSETNQPLRLTQAELEAHPRWRGFGVHRDDHPPLRGLLAVPLVDSAGVNMGLIQLSDKSRGEFTQHDQLVAVQFAQMASSAIERTRLIQRLSVRDRFFEMSAEILVIFNPAAGRWLQVNPVFSQITGYTAEELCSREFTDFIHPDDRIATRERAKLQQLRVQVPLHFENRYLSKQGDVRWISWTSVPGDDGLIYGVGRDVTEQHRAERRLSQTLTDLSNRNRELQDFAFIASHDLQEPLRKIRAFSDRLQQRHAQSLSAEGRDYLERTGQAAARMQTLIEDLLAYSRVVARGKAFAIVDLDQVLSGVIDDLEAVLETSGGRIQRNPLPTIEGDATQLRQLLQNLLSNALKFRAPDRPPVVKVSAVKAMLDGSPAWEIRIEDNGIGFEGRYADKIFRPFQRLHGRQDFQGSGIGLAIVRRIAERHRGTIRAEGRPGLGADFIMILPEQQPSGPAESQREPLA